jgi:MerR family transcriptional regulator, light-induced transcriptional regulator
MPGQLRIGELSRRSGVSAELLRAWERRYGLLRPTRSEGGYRLYSPEDERRVAAMRSHLDRGLSAAEAARLALDEAAVADTPALVRGIHHLRAALDDLDEAAAHAAFDRMLAELSLETVLRDAVLPYLRELGERWEHGDASIGQEHFASGVLRGRLLGLARGWDRGAGPRAVLACAPGEQHEFGLIAFGLGLRDNGWRITYLGPDTPLDTLAEIAEAVQPDAVVIAATSAARLEHERPALAALARSHSLWLAGPGALDGLSEAVGATGIDADPLAAAERVGTRSSTRAVPTAAQD